MNDNSVGVVGLGVVGGTIAEALEAVGVDVRRYDRYRPLGQPDDLASCGVVLVCVPTPQAPSGELDMAEVDDAVDRIVPVLEDGAVIGIKSTLPPGTTKRIQRRHPRFTFACIPEFLVAARPRETFLNPDRILIGVEDPAAAERIATLYRHMIPAAPVIVMRPIEAELAKLAANALLAAKVAMANQLHEICARHGVGWPTVQAVVGLDRRIGPDHLTVTEERGFGGACLPKDLDGLIAASAGAGEPAPLLRAISEFNRAIRETRSVEALGGRQLG